MALFIFFKISNIALLKLPNSFAHLEEKIPGFPAKQSISRPESSDKVVKCDFLQKKSAFISEF
ncbi:uncharacterized protein METZ01_LOCUS58349 [marine metagenome]|uniref:Uncharacterized protein n=1 Tax=marine metagenome TaxID=408172 RepID=A0A381SN96_9ZZZZ